MADGTDEGGARAVRMDEWVVWEVGDGIAPRGDGQIVAPFFSFFSVSICKGGTPVPGTCAQRTVEGVGSHLL